MDCSTPGFLVLHYLPEFAQTHVHGVSGAIQPSHPLSPSPSNEYSGLISFRIDWIDLLAVQGDFYEAEAEDHVLQFYLPIVTAFPPCLMRLVSPCLKNQ